MPLIYSETSAAEVGDILKVMIPVLVGRSSDAVGQACIALAILLQKKDIPKDRLLELIKSTSEYIALSVMDDLGTIQ